ncbi:MAG: DUF1257 domain-containing protein [Planctomycetales bacterium]|nr:DUF1257 domain-containing protein [Planctomycetales bacterium]
MSHIVSIKTEVRDANALRAGCLRLRWPPPIRGTHRLFQGEVTGLGVQLPDWKYAVVCDLTTGQFQYDNYGGKWGDPKHLDALLQSYAIEKAKLEARRQGHSVTESQLGDGSVKVTIHVGGAA